MVADRQHHIESGSWKVRVLNYNMRAMGRETEEKMMPVCWLARGTEARLSGCHLVKVRRGSGLGTINNVSPVSI